MQAQGLRELLQVHLLQILQGSLHAVPGFSVDSLTRLGELISSSNILHHEGIPIENGDGYEIGWLAGLVDGEGLVHTRYRSDRGNMYPRLRIYGTTKPIIDEAARLMGVSA